MSPAYIFVKFVYCFLRIRFLFFKLDTFQLFYNIGPGYPNMMTRVSFDTIDIIYVVNLWLSSWRLYP